MEIICETEEQFLNAIAGLVQRGLTFTARYYNLRITLEGGY